MAARRAQDTYGAKGNWAMGLYIALMTTPAFSKSIKLVLLK